MNRTRFTESEIGSLRARFAQITTVNPDRLGEFRAIFAGCSDMALVQLYGARINFVSTLAFNELNRRRERDAFEPTEPDPHAQDKTLCRYIG